MKKIFQIIVLLIIPWTLFAQKVTYSKDMLNGTEWIMQYSFNTGFNETWIFAKDEIIMKYSLKNGKTSDLRWSYYLSSTIPTKFDSQKVHTNSSGCYIITNSKDRQKMISFKIVSLSSNCLKLYWRGDSLAIGGDAMYYNLVRKK